MVGPLADMEDRIAWIDVPNWSMDELNWIGRLGFDKLRDQVAEGAIRELSSRSGGNPLNMQRACQRLHSLFSAEMQNAQQPLALSPDIIGQVFGASDPEWELFRNAGNGN